MTAEAEKRARASLESAEEDPRLLAVARKELAAAGLNPDKEEKELAKRKRQAAEASIKDARKTPPQGRSSQQRSTAQGGVVARNAANKED